MLRTCTSTLRMLHSCHHTLEVINFSLCVDARASACVSPAVGDPISYAVAIHTV